MLQLLLELDLARWLGSTTVAVELGSAEVAGGWSAVLRDLCKKVKPSSRKFRISRSLHAVETWNADGEPGA